MHHRCLRTSEGWFRRIASLCFAFLAVETSFGQQECTNPDFAIVYNGSAAFSVSQTNASCTCAGQIVSAAGFVGGPSRLSGLNVSGPLVADASALQGLLSNPDVAALVGVINSQQAQIEQLRLQLLSLGANVSLPSNSSGSSGTPTNSSVPLYRTCSEYLSNNAAVGDGVYTVYPTRNPEQGVQVWCDMSTDAGGWELVGRAGDTNGIGSDFEFVAASPTRGILDLTTTVNNYYSPQYVQALNSVLPPNVNYIDVQYYCYNFMSPASTNYWVKIFNVSTSFLRQALSMPNPDFLNQTLTMVNKEGVQFPNGYWAFFMRGQCPTGITSCGNCGYGQNGVKPSGCPGGQAAMTPRSVWLLVHPPAGSGALTEVSSCGANGANVMPYYWGEVRIRPSVGGLPPANSSSGSTSPAPKLYRSCSEYVANNGAWGSGVYTVYPTGQAASAVTVWCDMTTDGGGWSLLSRASDTNGIGTDYEFNAASPSISMLSMVGSVNNYYSPQFVQPLSAVLPAGVKNIDIQYYCYQTTSPASTNYWVKVNNVSVAQLASSLSSGNPDFLYNSLSTVNKDGIVQNVGTAYWAFFMRGQCASPSPGNGSSCGNCGYGQNGIKPVSCPGGQAVIAPRSVWYMSNPPPAAGGLTEVNSCGAVGANVLAFYAGEIRFRPTGSLPPPFNASAPLRMFRTCGEISSNSLANGEGLPTSGVYTVYPTLNPSFSTKVWCDMTTDGGGWELIARASDTNADGTDYEFNAASPTHSMLDMAYTLGTPYSAQYIQALNTILPSGRATIDIQYYCYQTTNPTTTNYWVKIFNVSVPSLLLSLTAPNPDFIMQSLTTVNKDGVVASSWWSFFMRGQCPGTSNSCGNCGYGQNGIKPSSCPGGQAVMTPRSVWYLSNPPAGSGGLTEVNSCGPAGANVLPYYAGEIRFR